MKKKAFSIVLAGWALHTQSVPHAQASTAAQASPWFGRIAALGAFYHSSATIATNGQLLPGAGLISAQGGHHLQNRIRALGFHHSVQPEAAFCGQVGVL